MHPSSVLSLMGHIRLFPPLFILSVISSLFISQRLFRFLSVIHLVHLWYLFLQCSSLILLVLFLFLVFNLIHSFLFQFSVLVIVFFSHILSFFFSHIQRIVKRIDLLFSLSFVMFSPSSSHSDHRRYFSVLAAR